MISQQRAGKLWPVAIIMVLIGDMVLGFFMIRLAANDPHAAVEPDYYHKAVSWDSTRAERDASVARGWSVTPLIDPVSTDRATGLTLQFRTSTGEPVQGWMVAVEAIPVAHAAESVQLALTPVGEGDYSALAPLHRTGIWELRIRATHGNDLFSQILRVETSFDAMARPVTARPGEAIPDRVAAGTRP